VGPGAWLLCTQCAEPWTKQDAWLLLLLLYEQAPATVVQLSRGLYSCRVLLVAGCKLLLCRCQGVRAQAPAPAGTHQTAASPSCRTWRSPAKDPVATWWSLLLLAPRVPHLNPVPCSAECMSAASVPSSSYTCRKKDVQDGCWVSKQLLGLLRCTWFAHHVSMQRAYTAASCLLLSALLRTCRDPVCLGYCPRATKRAVPASHLQTWGRKRVDVCASCCCCCCCNRKQRRTWWCVRSGSPFCCSAR
jgi:hypothetical protein